MKLRIEGIVLKEPESKEIQNLRDAIKLLPDTIDDPDNLLTDLPENERFMLMDVGGKEVLKAKKQSKIQNPERVRLYNKLVEKLGYEPDDVESPNMEFSENAVKAFKHIKALASEPAGTVQPNLDDVGTGKTRQAEEKRVVQRQQAVKAMQQLQSRAKNGDLNAQKILDELKKVEGTASTSAPGGSEVDPNNRLELTRPVKKR